MLHISKGKPQPRRVIMLLLAQAAWAKQRISRATSWGLPENGSMTRLRAMAPHTTPEREPVQVVPSQRVRAGQHDTEWPAFVFVTTGGGAGWVPERYLDTSQDPAVVITGYDTTELAITAGEELTLLQRDDTSGWAWVRNAVGREGWVPLRTIEPAPRQ